MKRFTKLLAGFLCACMIFPTADIPAAAMQAQNSIQIEEIIDEDDIVSDTKGEAAEGQEAELTYLVIGSDHVETPGTQYILAGVGDEDVELDAASISYTNKTTGLDYVKQADKISGNAALFNLNFTDNSAKGQYVVNTVCATIAGNTVELVPSEEGITAVFGVDTQVEAIHDELPSDIADDSEPGVIVVDVEKDELSSDDVAAAIAEVADGSGLVGTGKTGEYVVVLDPGHGGIDVGASGNGIIEKYVNLSIAQYCKAELEKYVGVKVYMTRSSDIYVDLDARAAYASSKSADLFISIHNNASTSSEANGASVYYPNSSYKPLLGASGKNLAAAIQKRLVALGLSDSGIYTRDYATYAGATHNEYYPDGTISDYYSIIRNAKSYGFTGLIVEHAYVSNPSDAATFLSSDAMLKKMGVADANAIVKYLGLKKTADTVYGTLDYSPVYNFEDYIELNKDVRKKYSNNPTGALKHFVEYGMAEGRVANKKFDVKAYKKRYKDLRKAYGDDWVSYYIHYLKWGKKEGRNGKPFSNKTTETVTTGKKTTTEAVSSDEATTTRKKKKTTTEEVTTEEATTTRKKKKTTTEEVTTEEATTTRKKKKTTTEEVTTEQTVPEKSKYTTVKDGVDYKDVYSFEYYTKKNRDIKRVFGDNPEGALNHFVNFGMAEGRQAIATFDVKSYRNMYSDLRSLFGNDLVKYYKHYMQNGKREGRIATGVTTLQNATTIYNGVDYRDVYNYDYYLESNPDVRRVIGTDENAVLYHFVNFGMSEGRKACEGFDVKSYRNANSDLRAVFGTNYVQYYLHYMNGGKNENRKTTGVTTILNPTTVYNGVDYRRVYDYDYYLKKNPDVRRAFGGDENAVIAHFVNWGMNEGRVASKKFDINIYMTNYGDLRNAFGNDLQKYYYHFMYNGERENRIGNKNIKDVYKESHYEIMGESDTTVKQMAAYYKSRATYPEFYADTDAPTIEAFCKIYIQECKAEGVKAEVAFCQAMKETGFLSYGGQVSITQFNFAGLGATDDGASGASFKSVRQGIRAQVQHLKAYASKEPLNKKCVDSRFAYVKRGNAPYVEWLGINENPAHCGWATAQNYGYSIVKDYINKLKKFKK